MEQIVDLSATSRSRSSRILKTTQHAANTHVQQVVNTVEVKTLKIIKKTMQGEKVDPDDQSSKHQTDRESSDSVLSRSRSSEFRKSNSKSRTRKDQSNILSQDRIKQRTVEQVVNMHASPARRPHSEDGRVQDHQEHRAEK